MLFTELPPIKQNGFIDRYFLYLSSSEISVPDNRTCYINNPDCFTEDMGTIKICYNDVDDAIEYIVSGRAGNGAGLGAESEVREILINTGLCTINVI